MKGLVRVSVAETKKCKGFVRACIFVRVILSKIRVSPIDNVTK